MQIRRLNTHTFDIFGGVGFDNWTRIRRFHWGWKQIGGTFLKRELLKEVCDKVERYPTGCIDNV